MTLKSRIAVLLVRELVMPCRLYMEEKIDRGHVQSSLAEYSGVGKPF